MPRPRAPVPPDPERLSRLLETAREARRAAVAARAEGVGGEAASDPSAGWVPAPAPDDADLSWLDDPWGTAVLESGQPIGPDPGGSRARGPGVVGGTSDAADVDAGTTAGEAAGDAGSASRGRHRRGPRVLTVPVPLRGAQVSVPWRAVVALLVVAAVAGLFFAVRVARAQDAAAPQVVPAGGGLGSGGLVGRSAPPTAFTTSSGVPTSPTGSAGSAGSGSASPGRLVVDVVGQVAHPGVVSVAAGSRVTDVLAAAGGALPGADVQRLNLARLVSDGEQLFVPRPGETPPSPLAGVGSGAGGSGGTDTSGPAAASGGVIDLNTATLATLDGLPGVGPVLAQRILDWRAEHGRFTSVDELGEVSGIGDKLLGQIRPKVKV